VLIVAIASNRGLCGAFNTNIIKQVKNLTENVYAGKTVGVFAIGKKANDVLLKTNDVIANRSDIYEDLSFDNIAKIAEALTRLFVDGEYDRIEIVYNQFKNAATQI